MKLVHRAAAAAVLLVLATGCGDTKTEPTAGGSSASETTSAAPTPAEPATEVPTTTPPAVPVRPVCDEVWAGQTLPRRYRGCLEGGTLVEAQAFTCSFGGVLVLYRNHYALAGRKINTTTGPATRDAGYGNAIRACAA